MGKRKPIDEEKLKKMAFLGCTYEEIATELGVCDQTIYRKYVSVVQENRQAGLTWLRKMGFKRIESGSDRILELMLKREVFKTHLDKKPENTVIINHNYADNDLDVVKEIRDNQQKVEDWT